MSSDAACSTGTLTISGSASLATYQTALRSVSYDNGNSDDPIQGSRRIDFSVNDGVSASAVLTTAMSVQKIDDDPVLTLPANAVVLEMQQRALGGFVVAEYRRADA